MAEVPFERVKDLLGQVRRLAPAERAAWLERACAGEPDLRDEVLALLREGERAEGFLEQPAEALFSMPDPMTDTPTGMPTNVGSYRVLGLLGAGGMGAVYEAEQDHPRRRVALKMVRHGVASPDAVRRFHRETGVLGKLHHPGIAQIYDAGTVDLGVGEQPYFAMELVHGRPLTAYADEQGLDTRARLQLFARVCDAVQHAHQNGVVHRDLKPDNILVTASPSTVTSTSSVDVGVGQPKVLDFGVARSVEPDAQLVTLQTTTGQLVGTLPYMSPEQVAGDSSAIDARSDVYALGVLLFELLARRLPHDLAGRSIPDAARVIQDEEPRRLSSVDTAFRGDLDTIVGKALEKDPARRYASAAELGADALRHLHHEPIAARPAGTLYQLRKFASRNRALVGGTLIAFAALLVGLVVSIRFGMGEAEQRGRAERREADARFAAYQAGLAAAEVRADPLAAYEELARAPEEFRGWEHGHLLARVSPVLWDHRPGDAVGAELVGAVAQDPDGRPLHVYASERGLVRVVMGGAGHVLRAGLQAVQRVALSRDGSVLAAVAGDPARLEVLRVSADPPLATRLWQRPIGGPCEALAMSDDGTRLAVHEPGVGVRVLQARDGAEAFAFSSSAPALGVSLSADGAVLGVASGQRTVHRVTADGAQLIVGVPSSIVAVDPAGDQLARRSDPGLRVQRVGAEPSRIELGGYSQQQFVLGFVSGGRRLVVGGGQRLELWDLATQDLDRVLFLERGSPAPGGVPRLGSAEDWLLASTTEGARAWSLGHRASRVLGRVDPLLYVYEAVFSPDGRLLASGGGRGLVRVWDVPSGELLAELDSGTKSIEGLAFADDGATLLAVKGQTAVGWDTALGGGRRALHEPEGTSVSWVHGAGRRAYWALADGGARVTSTPGFKQSRLLDVDQGVVLAGTAAGFELLDAATGEVLQRAEPGGADLPGDERPAVALSPTGELVASGHSDGSVRLWRRATGEPLALLEGHTAVVYSLDFSPDGERLVSGSRDGTLRLWHVERAAGLLVLPGHDDYVHSVCFSPDGSWIASGSGDGSVRLWDALPADERARWARADRAAREAMRPRVVGWLAETGDPATVAARLRADGTLGELERSAALRELLVAVSEGRTGG